jgi:diguanylate cyclase (GGDEF)-like protein
MEFYLLHPAFEMLFHTLGGHAGESNPETGYREHIDRFIKVSSLHAKVSLEQALIGEMLQRLWKQNQILARQATRDHLTGLLNRRGFFSIGTQFAFLAQRNNLFIAVMVVGLDGAGEITESSGHEAANAVLKGVAERITGTLRTSDFVGRYSGDEFAVLLSGVSADAVMQVAEKIRSTVAVEPVAGFTVTVSIGVAEAAIEGGAEEDLYGLLRNADLGLYRARKAGGNRVMRYAQGGNR